MVCSVLESFFVNRISFYLSTPLNFTIKEVVCAFIKSFFGGAPLNFTIKEIMGAILKSFVYWILIPKKMMCSVFKSFFLLEARGLTEFLACFLRWDNTLTSLGQIVTLGRKCLKLPNFPTFHGVQRFMRNARILNNFNRKGIRTIFLDGIVDGTTVRSVTAQVISHTAWQIAISADVLFSTRRRKDIDSGIFHDKLLQGLYC